MMANELAMIVSHFYGGHYFNRNVPVCQILGGKLAAYPHKLLCSTVASGKPMVSGKSLGLLPALLVRNGPALPQLVAWKYDLCGWPTSTLPPVALERPASFANKLDVCM